MNTLMTPKSSFLTAPPWRTLAALLAALALADTTQASQKSWLGGATDNNWASGGNWVGAVAPVNNDSVLFSGTQRTLNTNNITGLTLGGFAFNNSLFTIAGNLVTNTGGIYDNAGNNTNNLPIYWQGSQGITNAVSGTVLQLGGTQVSLGTANVLTFGGPGNIYMTGLLSSNAAVNINGDGAGNGFVRWSAANTFVGSLTINSGTLQLANAAAIPSGNGFGDVTNNAILDLNGNSETINGLFGSGTVDNVTSAASIILTVGNNPTNTGGNFFFNGNLQNTSGKIGLTKVNTNIFFLGGSPTYAGVTTVSAGTLALTNGAGLPNSSAITVAPGAVLDLTAGGFSLASGQTLTAGRATNNGPVDIFGDPQSSGAINIYKAGAAGTLTLSSGLTLNGGIINYDLANSTAIGGGTNDLIMLNGSLNLNSATTIRLNPVSGSFAVGSYTLISNRTATVSGSVANLTVETPRGITATLDGTTHPGSLLVGITGSSSPVALLWSGSISGDWDVNLTKNWTSNNVPDYFYNLDNVVFDDSSSNATINLPSGVSPFNTLISNSSSNYIFAGVGSITGSGGLTKTGTAQATFRNANSYLGNTTVNGGLLFLDILNSGSVVNQILYSGVTPGTLVMGGGTFQTGNRGNTTSYQQFGSTTLNPGASIINQNTRISGGAPAIYLGAITRNPGATTDFGPNVGSGGSQTVNTVGIFTTTANNNTTASGILGGYATYNAGEFARVNTSAGAQGGFHIYGGATYVNLFGANTNTDMTADLTAAINTNTMSVRFAAASARTLTLAGTNTITSGAVLVTSAVGANQSTITGGVALTSGNGQDLIVHQYDVTGNLLINSTITDNGSTSLGFTKAGNGTAILAGNNTYSGVTYINAGTLQVGNGGTVGSISTSTGVTNRGTLVFKHSDNISFGLPIAGSGGLSQLGTGSLTLTANNGFSGATYINAGSTLQLGTGGTAGTLGTTASIADNGSLIYNHSDNLSYPGAISGAGSLTLQGTGKVTLGGTNLYSGGTFINSGTLALGANASISNTIAIVVAGGSSLDVSAPGSLTLSGGTVNQVLAGSGTVIGSLVTSAGTGAGTRITPGTNGVYGTLTINNALTLNGGTLNLDVSTGSKDLIVVGGNLAINAGTVALNVSGTLPVGSYKLIQYAGALSGSAGNLVVSGFAQSGSVASLSSATPGEIDLVISSYVPVNLTWQGDGGNNYWDVLTSADWLSGSTPATYHQYDNTTFNDSSANTTVNLQTVVTPSQITINGTANSYTFQGSGSIGAGNLTVNNPNTTTILTANSSSGLTTINAGTLQLGNGTTAGLLGAGVVSNNAALVFNEPANEVVGNVLSGAGSVTHSDANTLSLVGNNPMTGPVTISAGILQVGVGGGSGTLGSGPVSDNSTLEISRAGTVTVANAISGSGDVIVDGPGTVTLSGANSYVNNTYISNGVVKLGSSSAIPFGGATTGWLVLDGGATAAGTLDLNGFNAEVNALSGLTATTVGQILNNGGTGTNTLTVDEIAATTFAGDILDNNGSGGKVALVMNGANVLTLTPGGNGSSYSGGTWLNNGTISGGSSTTANNNMLGTGPLTFGTNGTLQMAGWTGSTSPDYGTLANPIIVPSNVVATVLGSCRAGGGLSPAYATGATNSVLVYITRYVRGNVGGNWNGFFGTFMASNNASSAGNDFRLNTGTGFPNARLLLAPNAYMYNIFGGTPNIPIGELDGDSTTTIALNSGGGGLVARFVVGGLNTSSEFDGNITDTHGIIKVGTGTLTLGGATLSYTGPTTVSNGVIALTASATLSASTPITVAAPGVLDVSAGGTLTLGAQTFQGDSILRGSLATAAGSTVSPGGANALATLTVTNDLNLAGTAVMELNRTNTPGNCDKLVAHTIEAGGTLQVNNLGPDLHTGDRFQLFSTNITGAFAVTNLPITTSSGSITYVWQNHLAVDGSISVLVGVPNVNTTPTNITSSVSGNVLTLSWPADHTGWRLQEQTNSLAVGLSTSTNAWITVPDSSSVNTINLPIDPNLPTVFYRLVYP